MYGFGAQINCTSLIPSIYALYVPVCSKGIPHNSIRRSWNVKYQITCIQRMRVSLLISEVVESIYNI